MLHAEGCSMLKCAPCITPPYNAIWDLIIALATAIYTKTGHQICDVINHCPVQEPVAPQIAGSKSRICIKATKAAVSSVSMT
jgi:hypothetical protein